ncbi:MAG: prepilin peptidase [Rhodospirillaceae bacterium]
MDFPLLVDRLALTAFAGLLVWAAWSDLRDFVIPNRISIAIAMLFPAHVLATGAVEIVPGSVAAAAATFAAGFALFAFRVAGGGDVKLMTAVALWAGPSQIAGFLMMTALAGGLLAALLAARAWRAHAAASPDGSLALRVCAIRGTKVPYGAAIALGGLYIAAGVPV